MLRKSPGEVRDRINSDFPSKISIVHFIGHGDLQLRPTGPCPGQAGDENCIAFADSSTSSGYSDYSVEDFVQKVFVKKERPLALVFLNGCETVSIGLRIHEEENANNVVYWDTRCLSRGAQRFAEFFYSQLVNPRDGKIRSWSFERRCHAAFHHARTAMGQEHNMEKNPDALEYDNKTGVKRDSQGRVIMGRPRILPDFPSTKIPWGDEFQFTLRPVGRGVILAEGPSYGANSDHWPGQEAFLAEVAASVKDKAVTFVQSGAEVHEPEGHCSFLRLQYGTKKGRLQQLQISVLPPLDQMKSKGVAALQFKRYTKCSKERAVFVVDNCGMIKIGCREQKEKDRVEAHPKDPWIQFIAKVPVVPGRGELVPTSQGQQELFVPADHICIVETKFVTTSSLQPFNYIYMANSIHLNRHMVPQAAEGGCMAANAAEVAHTLLQDPAFPAWRALQDGKITVRHVRRAIAQLRGEPTAGRGDGSEPIAEISDDEGETADGVVPAIRELSPAHAFVAYCEVIPPESFEEAEELCNKGKGIRAALSLLVELVKLWSAHEQLIGFPLRTSPPIKVDEDAVLEHEQMQLEHRLAAVRAKRAELATAKQLTKRTQLAQSMSPPVL
jgi:hypothetical protein